MITPDMIVDDREIFELYEQLGNDKVSQIIERLNKSTLNCVVCSRSLQTAAYQHPDPARQMKFDDGVGTIVHYIPFSPFVFCNECLAEYQIQVEILGEQGINFNYDSTPASFRQFAIPVLRTLIVMRSKWTVVNKLS